MSITLTGKNSPQKKHFARDIEHSLTQILETLLLFHSYAYIVNCSIRKNVCIESYLILLQFW